MSAKNKLSFMFGLELARFMALNDDGTIPQPDRLIGGVGPFDFSGSEDKSAVELITKLDAGDEETSALDLSDAVDIKKVTVAEVIAAINAASPTELSAALEPKTDRIMLVCTDGNVKYVQVYGEAARLARFGQGWGLKFIKSAALKSIDVEPTVKESETITTTAANGQEASIVTRAYKKGVSGTIVDSEDNLELRAFIEGGTLKLDGSVFGGTYEDPTEDSEKPNFLIQAFYEVYREGLNEEGKDLVGYYLEEFRNCSGTFGSESHGRAFKDGNYAFIGTNYWDENGEKRPAKHGTMLSKESFEGYDIADV